MATVVDPSGCLTARTLSRDTLQMHLNRLAGLNALTLSPADAALLAEGERRGLVQPLTHPVDPPLALPHPSWFTPDGGTPA